MYYRNAFRRFRDYSMVALVGSYFLQVIDANVFSYMQDFEVNDDLSLKVSPTVISTYNEYALAPSRPSAGMLGNNALGLKIGLTF